MTALQPRSHDDEYAADDLTRRMAGVVEQVIEEDATVAGLGALLDAIASGPWDGEPMPRTQADVAGAGGAAPGPRDDALPTRRARRLWAAYQAADVEISGAESPLPPDVGRAQIGWLIGRLAPIDDLAVLRLMLSRAEAAGGALENRHLTAEGAEVLFLAVMTGTAATWSDDSILVAGALHRPATDGRWRLPADHPVIQQLGTNLRRALVHPAVAWCDRNQGFLVPSRPPVPGSGPGEDGSACDATEGNVEVWRARLRAAWRDPEVQASRWPAWYVFALAYLAGDAPLPPRATRRAESLRPASVGKDVQLSGALLTSLARAIARACAAPTPAVALDDGMNDDMDDADWTASDFLAQELQETMARHDAVPVTVWGTVTRALDHEGVSAATRGAVCLRLLQDEGPLVRAVRAASGYPANPGASKARPLTDPLVGRLATFALRHGSGYLLSGILGLNDLDAVPEDVLVQGPAGTWEDPLAPVLLAVLRSWPAEKLRGWLRQHLHDAADDDQIREAAELLDALPTDLLRALAPKDLTPLFMHADPEIRDFGRELAAHLPGGPEGVTRTRRFPAGDLPF